MNINYWNTLLNEFYSIQFYFIQCILAILWYTKAAASVFGFIFVLFLKGHIPFLIALQEQQSNKAQYMYMFKY